jgi:hypothetical protein
MFPQQPNRACLRSLLAHFFGKGDEGAKLQLMKPAVQDAIAVKIDLTSIACFNESELEIEPHDLSRWQGFVLLHLVLQMANFILKLSPRPLKRIIYGKAQVRMPLIGLCRAADVDFPTLRKHQMNIYLVKSRTVMATGALEHNAARRYPTIALLELANMLGNDGLNGQTCIYALEIDFDWDLHANSSSSAMTLNRTDSLRGRTTRALMWIKAILLSKTSLGLIYINLKLR